MELKATQDSVVKDLSTHTTGTVVGQLLPGHQEWLSVFNFLVPIFGVILSAIFLGESILEWKNVVALALVCSGIWLVTKGR